MAQYADYSTVNEVRATYRGTTATGQDTLFSELIRSTSRDIEAACGGRRFYARIETRRFDYTADRQLDLDDDLLAVTTVTNGDATTVAATDYHLLPYYGPPYYAIRLNEASTVLWQLDSSGNSERVIQIAGQWGWHPAYADIWLDTGGTLAAAITSTTATTTTCTTGTVRAGYLIKIDSEYLHVSAVTTGASDTLTIVRGVNGSTAASHLISAPISRWYFPSLEMICRMAVSAYERLKNNPVGETVRLDGQSFSTPKDVKVWVESQLESIGARRPF